MNVEIIIQTKRITKEYCFVLQAYYNITVYLDCRNSRFNVYLYSNLRNLRCVIFFFFKKERKISPISVYDVKRKWIIASDWLQPDIILNILKLLFKKS